MFGMLLVLSLCALVTPSPIEPTMDIIIQRINYGVIFKEESKLLLAKENWLHTFHVELPKRFQLSKVPFCNVQNRVRESSCTLLDNMVNFIHGLHEETLAHLNQTLLNIRTMIPQTQILKKRQARALLPFIGSLSKSIFGTATMDDVNILAGHINALNSKTEKMAKALEQHSAHLSSFISH